MCPVCRGLCRSPVYPERTCAACAGDGRIPWACAAKKQPGAVPRPAPLPRRDEKPREAPPLVLIGAVAVAGIVAGLLWAWSADLLPVLAGR